MSWPDPQGGHGCSILFLWVRLFDATVSKPKPDKQCEKNIRIGHTHRKLPNTYIWFEFESSFQTVEVTICIHTFHSETPDFWTSSYDHTHLGRLSCFLRRQVTRYKKQSIKYKKGRVYNSRAKVRTMHAAHRLLVTFSLCGVQLKLKVAKRIGMAANYTKNKLDPQSIPKSQAPNGPNANLTKIVSHHVPFHFLDIFVLQRSLPKSKICTRREKTSVFNQMNGRVVVR